ncbi:hypothetical protein BUZ16_12675 [Staphylococcus haemolyticus]|uniref:hypothetical protein n=1 Tax=Staphylococcus haemolyticus TaxID=1283 RepID=UPI000D1E4A6E|nr:hypothetical protein [Staphylococcus haemolyticus]PTK79083.1 hypothetical protein BUZ16_12675 [Staphylococcus haemolyticus]
MPKIKRKVEMKLPKLIEWAWENEVSNKAFYSNYTGGSVFFNDKQILYLEHEIRKDETFTVEIEEEITEDTVFPVLIKTLKNAFNEITVIPHENASINLSKSNNETISYHILNDDGTMTLLWEDGAMVDD